MERIDPIHLRAKHRHERGENVRITRGAARAQDAFRFVDEEKREKTFAAFFARGRENFAHDPFRFAHPHVQNLRAFDVHEIFLHLVARFFAELFRQVVSGGFADERFAAAGRAVEQKSFRRRVLEFLEKLAVDERQLDRVLDRLQRLVLSAHFFPGQFRHLVEVMLARLRMGQNFQRHAIIRIDPNFIAGLEGRLHQLGGALEDERLQSMFGADPQPVRPEHLRDFRHGPGGLETKIAHDDVSFVDQNARAFLELRETDARIDVAIIIRAADDNVRRVARRIAEISADAIRGRGHLLDDFLELLDHLLRFTDRLFLRGNLRADQKQLATISIVGRKGSENQIEGFEQTKLALSPDDPPGFRIPCCARRSFVKRLTRL